MMVSVSCCAGVLLIISSLTASVRSLEDCVLPDHPANGRHESHCPTAQRSSPACRGEPGTPVSDGWFIFTRCSEGFVLDYEEHGHSQSTCTDGSWKPTPPSCVCKSLEDCVLPDHPANGRHESHCPTAQRSSPACRGEPGTPVSDGWFIFTRCSEGFILDYEEHGHSQSTCTDGSWKPTPPSCVYNLTNDRYKCKAPPYPQHGRYEPLPIECNLNNKTESLLLPGTFVPDSCVILFFCDSGYLLNELDVMSICDRGKWIPDTVTCQVSAQASTRTSPSRHQSSGCTVPSEAQNQRYCSFQCKECTSSQCSYAPGSVFNGETMQVKCAEGYTLGGNQDYAGIPCVNGTWTEKFPPCLKLCAPLESDSVFSICKYGNSVVDCTKPMLPGTFTTGHQCKPSYREFPDLIQAGHYKRTLTCRHTGKWTDVQPVCKPVCGVSQGGIKITPTIVDGTDTPLGAFPWHAGLYWQKDGEWVCFCGGTLISNRLILTAAHCVISLVDTPENLQVALGKVHRDWSYDEPHTVKRTVSNVEVPSYYNPASRTYLFDMALLLLSKKVQVNNFIMPVCRDVNLDLKITGTSTGYVVGWGLTSENGKASETLLHNDFSIMDYKTCHGKVISKELLTYDKFCGAKNSGSVAQKGDSGGGVTTVYNQQHYVIGIVSSKFSNDLSLFTNLSLTTHRSWIETSIEKFDKLIM